MSAKFRILLVIGHFFFWSFFYSPHSAFSSSVFPPRQDGEYLNTGYPQITTFSLGNFVHELRQQLITVTGDSLPRTLTLESTACSETAVIYGSSQEFRFLCVLNKVPQATFRFIDRSNGSLVSSRSADIREIFDVKVTDDALFGRKLITVTGANLPPNLQVLVPECSSITLVSKDKPEESKYACDLKSANAPTMSVRILSSDNHELFSDTITLITTTNQKRTKKTLLDSDWLRLICEQLTTEGETQSLLYLGECQMTSPFIREAFVSVAGESTAQQSSLAKAVMEGKFEATLGKSVDAMTSNLHGLKLNPATGYGLFTLDVPDLTMMMEGYIQGIGFDMQNVLFFPINFNLYEYQGKILISAPSFDVNKNRDRSKVVFGIGDVPGRSINILEKARGDLRDMILVGTKALSGPLNKKKIELGAKLMTAINSTTGKQIARKTYISVLKMLQIVPEALGFYDNFDFIAKGKLISEPFRPASWKDDSPFALQANLASLDLDFTAKTGTMKIRGDFLNNLSLFNMDLIKPDQGLIKTGILLSLKEDDGKLILDPVLVRLPAGIAEAQAYLEALHLFKPSQLVLTGAVKANISPFGLELVQADAELNFNPNAVYQIGDYKSVGVLDLLADTKLILIGIKGRAVFTAPGNQAVMDLGGRVGLDFLGYKKDLLDALSRVRLSTTGIKMCVNTKTGKITFTVPMVKEKIELQAGVSLDTEMSIKPGWIRTANLDLKYLAMSGQANDQTRMGFKVSSSGKWYELIPTQVERWDQPCTDAPGDEFLKKVPSILKDRSSAKAASLCHSDRLECGIGERGAEESLSHLKNRIVTASASPQIIAEAFAANESDSGSIDTSWNVNGWKILGVSKDNGNRIIIVDKNRQEVKLDSSFIAVPGVWKFENPLRFVIYSEEEMKNGGYTFAIRKENSFPVEFGISTYTNDLEKSHAFMIETLDQTINTLDFANLENAGKIMVNGASVAAKHIDTRTVSRDERKVEAEVSSTPFSEYPNEQKSGFSDIKSPVLQEAINFLVQKYIIKGYPDGTFKPDKPLNRAEAIALLSATGKIKIPWEDVKKGYVTMKTSFQDVKSDDWFFGAVADAEKAKILDSNKNRLFKPDQVINRAEFIKMLITMLEEKPKKNLSRLKKQFKDVKRAEWYVPYASAALERNLLDKGKALRPAAPMTRADAALMIYRMMKRDE